MPAMMLLAMSHFFFRLLCVYMKELGHDAIAENGEQPGIKLLVPHCS